MIDRSFVAIFVTLSILSGLLYHLNSNTVLAVSMPSFVDPFTTSQSLPTYIQDEVCNDGVDNDRNGLVDENCGSDSESITKLVEGISRDETSINNPLPQPESSINEQLPEQEICNDNQDNDGNGMVDENCGVSNNNDGNQNTVIPEQEICGDLVDNDGNGLADEMCEINTTPNTDGSNPPISDNGVDTNPSNEAKTDKFGIRMLYPSKPNGEQWYIRADHPEKDPQFRPQVPLSKNSDGSFKVTEGKIRMGVWPSTGNHPEKITTYNEKELEKKGYMESPNDWRNVEITGYVKFNKGVNYDNFAWYARGGIHTNGKECEGTAYKGQLYYSGKTRFAKEQWFVSYVFSPYKQSMGSMNGKWIGFKTAMYNVEKNGHLAVKLEIWLDKSNDGNWQKVYDYIDDGGWGNDGQACGGRPDQIISWGGPLAAFRWDNADDVDIKDFSVREILPNL
ncbi:MAG TPA: hypothetical protein VFI64_00285 [Nitrososphaeraceae archaeon]|nr:hypothetical protein [Nitrososphaeraceae archaeon]